MTTNYHGWDVHSWTKTLCDVLKERPHLLSYLSKPLTCAESTVLFNDIVDLMPNTRPVLKKIQTRSTISSNQVVYKDPQLFNINILVLLKESFEIGKEEIEPSLLECGSTCIQGDSHRLLWYYLSLTNSLIVNK